MQELCIQSINRQDQEILQEIVFKFSYIQQLYSHLQPQEFSSILAAITHHTLPHQSALAIQPNKIYLFFSKGHLINKQKQAKGQSGARKCVLRSMKRRIGHYKSLYKTQKDKQSNRYQISQLQAYFDVNGNCLRYDKVSYYAKGSKQCLVLMLDLSHLADTIKQKIQQINYDKIKCIYNYSIFQQVDRETLKEYINHFHFTSFKFHEYLYHEHSTTPLAYLVKAGTVEISNKSLQHTYAMDGKFIIGFKREEKERAKAISEMIVCYSISHKALVSILNKASFKELQHVSHHHSKTSLCSAVLTPVMYEDQSMLTRQNSIFKNRQEGKQSISMLKKSSSQLFKRSLHHKTQSVEQIQQKMTKRLKLRRHFSNFYNEVFDAYSQKKIKELGLKINEHQNLSLYEIKLLKKRMPAMDQIRQKLKKIKEYKMKLCKFRLQEMENRRPYVA